MLLNTLRYTLLLIIILLTSTVFGQIKIMTWNVQNLGKSKSPEEIAYMAKIMAKADLVALQEVVTSFYGAKATSSLLDALNRSSGAKWEYRLSDPTQSSPYRTERYAYFWKTSKIRVKGKAFLDENYVDEIEREPFLQTFIVNKKEFTLVNFHALPKKHQPEKEIKYLKFFPEHYSGHTLIFLGDFNTPQKHSVFNPLKKMGYQACFLNQKTTLRQKCIQGDCLASEYDNVFIPTDKIKLLSAQIIPFYEDFEEVILARKISDHVPLLVEIELN